MCYPLNKVFEFNWVCHNILHFGLHLCSGWLHIVSIQTILEIKWNIMCYVYILKYFNLISCSEYLSKEGNDKFWDFIELTQTFHYFPTQLGKCHNHVKLMPNIIIH